MATKIGRDHVGTKSQTTAERSEPNVGHFPGESPDTMSYADDILAVGPQDFRMGSLGRRRSYFSSSTLENYHLAGRAFRPQGEFYYDTNRHPSLGTQGLRNIAGGALGSAISQTIGAAGTAKPPKKEEGHLI